MPEIFRFKGKFISRSRAEEMAGQGLGGILRELYESGSLQERTEVGGEAGVAEREERPVGNWVPEEYRGGEGLAWVPEDYSPADRVSGDPGNPGTPLNYDALQEADPPWGMSSYRVRYKIPQMDSRYPRGYASSDWISTDFWPPSMDLAKNVRNPEGIAMIHFDTAPA